MTTVATSIAPADLMPPAPNVEVFCSFDDLDHLRAEWDAFVQAAGGDLYVTFDWLRIWWRHYGRNRSLRLFVFRRDRVLVGLVPMFIERVWTGPIYLRLAKMVGSDFALTMFAPPLRPDLAEAIYRHVVAQLTTAERCDAVWFGALPGTDAGTSSAEALRAACRNLRGVRILRDVERGPHTVFHLPPTFSGFVESLNKRQRQNYRRDRNLLAKSFEVSSDVCSAPPEALTAFDRFKEMHDRQWLAEGKLGHFGDWPGSEDFNRDLVSELSKQSQLRIMRLSAGGNVVSYQYGFVFGGCCYWRLPARAPGAEWDRFGLGRMGLVTMIEALISAGVGRIEAGAGHYDYKVQLGGTEYPMRSILIVQEGLGARLRSWWFCRMADWLDLFYYRLWFLKLAPRLRLPRGPLWRTWIRSRL